VRVGRHGDEDCLDSEEKDEGWDNDGDKVEEKNGVKETGVGCK